MESLLHLVVAVLALLTVDVCHCEAHASVYFPVFGSEDINPTQKTQTKAGKSFRAPESSEEILYPREATTIQSPVKKVTPYYTGDIGKLPLSIIPNGRFIGGNGERKRKKAKKPKYLIHEEHYPELPSAESSSGEDAQRQAEAEAFRSDKQAGDSESRTVVPADVVPEVLEKPPGVEAPVPPAEQEAARRTGGGRQLLQEARPAHRHAPSERPQAVVPPSRPPSFRQLDAPGPSQEKVALFINREFSKPVQFAVNKNNNIPKTERPLVSEKESISGRFKPSPKEFKANGENWNAQKTEKIHLPPAPQIQPQIQPSVNAHGFQESPIPHRPQPQAHAFQPSAGIQVQAQNTQNSETAEIPAVQENIPERKTHNWNSAGTPVDTKHAVKHDLVKDSRPSTPNDWRNSFLGHETHRAQNVGAQQSAEVSRPEPVLSEPIPNPHTTHEAEDREGVVEEEAEEEVPSSESPKRKKGERRKILKKVEKVKSAKVFGKPDEHKERKDKHIRIDLTRGQTTHTESVVESPRQPKFGKGFGEATKLNQGVNPHFAESPALAEEKDRDIAAGSSSRSKIQNDAPTENRITESSRTSEKYYGARAREFNYDPEVSTKNAVALGSNQFRCTDYEKAGIYADVDSGCKVYHICESNGRSHTFECPSGTLFDQRFLVCAWEYTTSCAKAQTYYRRNNEIYTGKEQHVYL